MADSFRLCFLFCLPSSFSKRDCVFLATPSKPASSTPTPKLGAWGARCNKNSNKIKIFRLVLCDGGRNFQAFASNWNGNRLAFPGGPVIQPGEEGKGPMYCILFFSFRLPPSLARLERIGRGNMFTLAPICHFDLVRFYFFLSKPHPLPGLGWWGFFLCSVRRLGS